MKECRINKSNRRTPLHQIDAARICIVKPSALGDIVQALPVLSALRARFPQAHIAWLVNKSYATLLTNHPHLNEIIAFDRGANSWSPSGCRSIRRLCVELRQQQFDLVCDLQGLLRSGLMTWATCATRRVGLSDCREGSRYFYSDIVHVPLESMSAVDRYWLVVQALGAGDNSKQFLVGLADGDLNWAQRQLQGLSCPVVALHTGARWSTKRWPPQSFCEVARRLVREFDASILLVGGPEASGDAQLIETELHGRCLNLVGRTTLRQLAAVLARVQLMISNDSGPMHLAAAMGTPVAAIFTCTSPARARPYGTGHTILGTNVWCAASYLRRCSRLDCMIDLTPDRIWPALSAQMTKIGYRLQGTG
jgi:lipopolysaccharide heptosyltransferase I